MAGQTTGQILRGGKFNYINADDTILGEGTFGSFWKYKISGTDKEVAIKVVNASYEREVQVEVKNLKRIRSLDADKNNLVKCIELLKYNNVHYLVYEMLDMSLQDFMERRDFEPLEVRQIRVIAKQMFEALDALKTIHVIHGDIKPDNIMLVNHKLQPLKVKLIDFGVAPNTSNLVEERARVSLLYRAPEVLIGHPSCHEAMDMWSLGCVLLYLFLGHHLFSCTSEYGALLQMTRMIGELYSDLLKAGDRSKLFYKVFQDVHEEGPYTFWELKSPEEYTECTGVEVDYESEVKTHIRGLRSLSVIQNWRNPYSLFEEMEVEELFHIHDVHLLLTDPNSRITPRQALSHELITMSHLADYSDSRYVITAQQMMGMCPVEEYEDDDAEEKRYFCRGKTGSSGRNGKTSSDSSDGRDWDEEDSSSENEFIPFTIHWQNSSSSSNGRDMDEEDNSSENEVIDVTVVEQDSSETLDVIKRKEVIPGTIKTATMAGQTTGQILRGGKFNYINADDTILGEGTFGSFWKYKISGTDEEVAIKVVNASYDREVQVEVKNLKRIRSLDADKNNLVKCIELFKNNNVHYLVYEMLDMSLQDFMERRDFEPLEVRQIRVIAKQMFEALDALNTIHVIHGDIKPDNIMLVNHKLQPLKVKLIDFGVAPDTSNLVEERARVSLLYRAPEVLIGHPSCHEAMDMWSLGCVLLYLLLGRHLFSCTSEYGALLQMTRMIGGLGYKFVEAGARSKIFYERFDNKYYSYWDFKSPLHYTEDTGVYIELDTTYIFESLSAVSYRVENKNRFFETLEVRELIDLHEQMLVIIPDRRITSFQALSHKFITMSHLADYSDSRYMITAQQMMAMCPVEEYEDDDDEEEEERCYNDYLQRETRSDRNGEDGHSSHESEVIDVTADEQNYPESSDGRDVDEEDGSSEKELINVTVDEQDSSETVDVIKRREVIPETINVKTLDVKTGCFEAGSTQEEITPGPRVMVRVRKVQQKEQLEQLRGKFKMIVAETASSTWSAMKLPGKEMESSDIAAAVYRQTDRPAGKTINTRVAGSHSKTDEISCEKDKKTGFYQTFTKCFHWIGKFISGLFKWKKDT